MAEAPQWQTVGEQFIQHYYNTFDTNRPELASLYAEQSMLSFEGEQFMGIQAIFNKYNSLGTIKHVLKSIDVHPTINDGIVCFVNGDLFIGEDTNGVKFAEVFLLQNGGSAGIYVHNDIFRLNYG